MDKMGAIQNWGFGEGEVKAQLLSPSICLRLPPAVFSFHFTYVGLGLPFFTFLFFYIFSLLIVLALTFSLFYYESHPPFTLLKI